MVIPIPRHVDYFEVGAFGVCALYGLITLVRYDQLASIALKAYPSPGGLIYVTLLTAGGVTGLAGHVLKSLTGLRLELAGLTLLVLLCVAYTLWTPFSAGWRGVGLLMFMGILIAVPGFFARRRLAKYIHKVEDIQNERQAGGGESEGRGINSGSDSMGGRTHRRWWSR